MNESVDGRAPFFAPLYKLIYAKKLKRGKK